MEADDRRLDEQIRHLMFESKSLVEAGPSSQYAFVTFEDLRQVPSMEDQTILAIKAPIGTRLEVPDPDEETAATGRRRFQIHLKSDKAIDIYLVSKQDPVPAAALDAPIGDPPTASPGGDLPPINDPTAIADNGLLRPNFAPPSTSAPLSPGGLPLTTGDNADYYLNMYNADGLTDFYTE